MTCEYLGEHLGKYDCGCAATEKDVAVRRCAHPDGLVELAIEISPGNGVVDRLRVIMNGAEGPELRNVARCQRCTLNTDPPPPPKPRSLPPLPDGSQVAAAAPAVAPPPIQPQATGAGRRTWVDPSRIRAKSK